MAEGTIVITLSNQTTPVGGKVFCPPGWHVPTMAECVTLMLYLDNDGDGGTKTIQLNLMDGVLGIEIGTEHFRIYILIHTFSTPIYMM
jgi:hypothetical protein